MKHEEKLEKKYIYRRKEKNKGRNEKETFWKDQYFFKVKKKKKKKKKKGIGKYEIKKNKSKGRNQNINFIPIRWWVTLAKP